MTDATRRSILTALGSILTVGCVGQTSRSSNTTTAQDSRTATTTSISCSTEYKDPTQRAIDKYRTTVDTFAEVHDLVGTPAQFEADSVMGSSAFFHMNCSSEDGCESEFLSAIEKFRRAKRTVLDVKHGFNALALFVQNCDVDESSLFTTQIENGIAKCSAYVHAIEDFTESSKRHVDEDLQQFSPEETFETGLEEYREARQMEVMTPELLEKKVTVYNG